MLIAALQEYTPSCVAIDCGIAKDTMEDLQSKVTKALNEVDVLITTGGVSMGELDLMQPLLQKIGQIHFGRVLMKPGKPLTFATVEVNQRKKLVFGLPGNPVSTMVTFFLVCAPALRKLAGFSNPYFPEVQAKTTQPLDLDPERPEYHRCVLSWGKDGFIAESTGKQTSSRLLSMRSANALLKLPQTKGILPVGSTVTAICLTTNFI